jgi:nickel-type superoxide dismutase maturation protease
LNWTVQCSPVYTHGVRGLLPLRRFVVQDTSMSPVLQPGDRVVVFQWRWAWRPRAGAVVVFTEPDRHLTFAVKRIVRVQADGTLLVQGDNPNVSRDSREFGPVAPRLVVGSVIYRYLPAERRGRLRSAG